MEFLHSLILSVIVLVSISLVSIMLFENINPTNITELVGEGCTDELCSNLSSLKLDEIHYNRWPELGFLDDYENLRASENTVVIFPAFTQSAYAPNGFYSYYHGDCDQSCLTVTIDFETPDFRNSYPHYSASAYGFRVLQFLDYETLSDVDVDKNPKILENYDKVILLHNEYVTQNEFAAITGHPNVVYLYPNALHAEISVNYDSNTITLLKGHSYPEKKYYNGFGWKYENTRPFEYDHSCDDWYFWKIENGNMLSCYPEFRILRDAVLVKTIKEL
jgi:hypothetical protein